MLNRTNQTLSALSNRLNLGTRSLVLVTGVNSGANTLRTRQVHHDVMRVRMVWHVVSVFGSSKCDIPSIPGSPIPGAQQRPGRYASAAAASRAASPDRDGHDARRGRLARVEASRRNEAMLRSSRPTSGTKQGTPTGRKQRPGQFLGSAGNQGRAYAARAAIAAAADA